MFEVQASFIPSLPSSAYIYIYIYLYFKAKSDWEVWTFCSIFRLVSGGGGALECNLTGRCPFFKNLHNPFWKKNLHFDALFQNY